MTSPRFALTAQRFGFCAVAAVVAAAVADPLIELASNAGAFGTCNCTDRSNLDVGPALAVALLLGIALLFARVRKLLAGFPDTLRPGRLVPCVLALQFAVLYAMETAEQIVVAGHPLGGTVWLGGPVAISLAVHAAFGISAAFAVARVLSACTRTAVRIVVLLRLITAVTPRGLQPTGARFRDPAAFRRLLPVLCRIGERAPPLAAA